MKLWYSKFSSIRYSVLDFIDFDILFDEVCLCEIIVFEIFEYSVLDFIDFDVLFDEVYVCEIIVFEIFKYSVFGPRFH